MKPYSKKTSTFSVFSTILMASLVIMFAGDASAAGNSTEPITANVIAPVEGQLFPPGGIVGATGVRNDPTGSCPAGTALSWVGSTNSGGAIQCVTLPVYASPNTACASGNVMTGLSGGNATCQSTASLAGPTGATGPTGPQGSSGFNGPTGPTGPTGPAGSGVALGCSAGQVVGYDSGDNLNCIGLPGTNPLFVVTVTASGWGGSAHNPSPPTFTDTYGNSAPNVTAPYRDGPGTFNALMDKAQDIYEHTLDWAPSAAFVEGACRVTDDAGNSVVGGGKTMSDILSTSGCLTAYCMGGFGGRQPLLAFMTGSCVVDANHGCTELKSAVSCMYISN